MLTQASHSGTGKENNEIEKLEVPAATKQPLT